MQLIAKKESRRYCISVIRVMVVILRSISFHGFDDKSTGNPTLYMFISPNMIEYSGLPAKNSSAAREFSRNTCKVRGQSCQLVPFIQFGPGQLGLWCLRPPLPSTGERRRQADIVLRVALVVFVLEHVLELYYVILNLFSCTVIFPSTWGSFPIHILNDLK